jgi:hypothetical protein
VVDRAIEVLTETTGETPSDGARKPAQSPARRKKALPMFGTLASVALAFFPKCPVCWAAYLSVFGIAGLEQIPYSPSLKPVLLVVMLINLASIWLRGRSTGRRSAFYFVSAGAVVILVSKMGLGLENIAAGGIVLTLAGSLLSALTARNGRTAARS